jgi:hypothetical protein
MVAGEYQYGYASSSKVWVRSIAAREPSVATMINWTGSRSARAAGIAALGQVVLAGLGTRDRPYPDSVAKLSEIATTSSPAGRGPGTP